MLSRLKIPSRFAHTGAGIRADSIQQERPHCVSHAHRGGNERGDYLLGNLTCLSPRCSFPPHRVKETLKRTVKTFAIAPWRTFLDGKLEEEPRRGSSLNRRSFNEKEKRERTSREEEEEEEEEEEREVEGTLRYAISRVAKVAGSPKVCGARSKKK